MDYNEYITNNTLRCEASYRGGGIEISLSKLLPELEAEDGDEPMMSAYQNYLGGGLLGRICSSTNFDKTILPAKDLKIVNEVETALKRYFHNLTNHDGNEWEAETFEQNQLNKPISAY